MHIFVSLYISAFCIIFVNAYNCVTPNNEKAQCISLNKCPVLLRAAFNKNNDDIQKLFLKNSVCHYPLREWGNMPVVCCGSIPNYKKILECEENDKWNKFVASTTTLPTKVSTIKWKPSITTMSFVQPKNTYNLQTTPSAVTERKPTDQDYVKKLEELLPPRNVCGHNELADKIIGGTEAEIGEFPWMVQLLYRNRTTGQVIEIYNICGGSLISKNYVITAAHCVVGRVQVIYGDIHMVRLGEHDITTEIDCNAEGLCNDKVVDVLVSRAITFKEHTKLNRYYDIALLRLAQTVIFTGRKDNATSGVINGPTGPTTWACCLEPQQMRSYDCNFIKPICLPIYGETEEPDKRVVVAGWGSISPTEVEPSDVKMKVHISIVDKKKCSATYRNINKDDSRMCAGNLRGKDSCIGDSGGPLMTSFPRSINWYLVGIVSYGPKKCGNGKPAVYVRVRSYLDWIAQNIEP